MLAHVRQHGCRTPKDHCFCSSLEDTANAGAFLAGDKASYITGQVFYVDGGAMALGQRRLPPLDE